MKIQSQQNEIKNMNKTIETPKNTNMMDWAMGIGALFNPIMGTAFISDKALDKWNDGNGIDEFVQEKSEDLVDFATPYIEVTKNSMTDADNVWDFLNKSNYIAANVIHGGFDINQIDQLNNSWEVLKDAGKEVEFEVIQNDLSEEDNLKAMAFAISLLETRIEGNKEYMPEYGDCKTYYNEGHLHDWLITHPASFLLSANSETAEDQASYFAKNVLDSEGEINFEELEVWKEKYQISDETAMHYMEYKGAYQNSYGKEAEKKENWWTEYKDESYNKQGMYAFQDIPSYIADKIRPGNEGVRVTHATDLLQINSTTIISEQLQKQEQLLEELKASVNDPEKFAQVYYQITNGLNFDANKVLDYFNEVMAGETPKCTPEVIIGRDFISEDIAKNRIGTDALFETNKTVGTVLCRLIPDGAGIIAAVGTNLTVTAIENETQGEKEIKLTNTQLATRELARSFAGMYGEEIAKSILRNTKFDKNMDLKTMEILDIKTGELKKTGPKKSTTWVIRATNANLSSNVYATAKSIELMLEDGTLGDFLGLSDKSAFMPN